MMSKIKNIKFIEYCLETRQKLLLSCTESKSFAFHCTKPYHAKFKKFDFTLSTGGRFLISFDTFIRD